jgi:hypothetical protein
MTTPSVSEVPKLQWHFALVLLPFIIGIYLADYRNLTEGLLLFFKFFTVGGILLLLSKSLRQFGLLFSFTALGFWLLYSRPSRLLAPPPNTQTGRDAQYSECLLYSSVFWGAWSASFNSITRARYKARPRKAIAHHQWYNH